MNCLALFIIRPQQPFLVNLLHLIIRKPNMQSDRIRHLNDFFYSAFSELWMRHHIIDLEFYFAVFGTLVGLLAAVGVADVDGFVMNGVLQCFIVIVL